MYSSRLAPRDAHLSVHALSHRQNRLTALPGDLDALGSLQVLSLSSNQLEELPEAVAHLPWYVLNVFLCRRCCCCCCCCFYSTIRSIAGLRTICSGSCFAIRWGSLAFRYRIYLTAFSFLLCLLKHSLRQLFANGNKIRSVPESLCTLPELKVGPL